MLRTVPALLPRILERIKEQLPPSLTVNIYAVRIVSLGADGIGLPRVRLDE